jgi:hypothetical protein
MAHLASGSMNGAPIIKRKRTEFPLRPKGWHPLLFAFTMFRLPAMSCYAAAGPAQEQTRNWAGAS